MVIGISRHATIVHFIRADIIFPTETKEITSAIRQLFPTQRLGISRSLEIQQNQYNSVHVYMHSLKCNTYEIQNELNEIVPKSYTSLM